MSKIKDKKTWLALGFTEDEIASLNIPDRQLFFVYYYVTEGFNGGRAYSKAYRVKKGADQAASRLLRNAKVRKAVSIVITHHVRHIRDTIETEIIDKARAIITAHISDYVNEDGSKKFESWDEVDCRAVKSIDLIPLKYGDRWKLELHDPKPWVEILNKFMQLADGPDKVIEIRDKRDLEKYSDEELRELMVKEAAE